MLTVHPDMVPVAFAKHRNLLLFLYAMNYQPGCECAFGIMSQNILQTPPYVWNKVQAAQKKYAGCQSKLLGTTAS